ncbi:E3 ubiquitin-protein ligase RNF12-like protein [Anticarsia gemmatalis multiple nucleopolyhedrovirus]|uniref:E3 ubiquitin-protein ligase RNF12-like protein n=1 Tax=Anticarsia gemmatalis multiple nucleopolyhedrovirus TaxID=268591 RepID=A0A0S3J0C1_9ABAC|nr:E3 ubiquitin-protein ligase RNF12-like protein [Anticarsia gemmatalis multiple nucleopolyhedrovirus]ALR71673.1 E3 ubiquitin-protein ligase RNF12-like protein [Anticarsia gemmatalis multiple nucleopolyhedrovirus]
MDSRNEALHDAETIAEQTEFIQTEQNAETNTDEQNQNAQNLLTIAAATVGIGIGASLIYYFFYQPHNRASDNVQNRIINKPTTNYRNRPWSDEDCSICFDNMLKNQDITSLNCAHRFHTNCLLSWLKNRQSCPNCRCSV